MTKKKVDSALPSGHLPYLIASWIILPLDWLGRKIGSWVYRRPFE